MNEETPIVETTEAPIQVPDEPSSVPEALMDTSAEVEEVDEVPSQQEAEPTQQEIDPEIVKKAAFYDQIDSNPELVELIENYYNRKMGQVGPSDDASGEQPVESAEQMKLLKTVEQMGRAIQKMQADLQISEFARAHPDFEDVRQDMGRLIQRHPTYSLQEAYDFVKGAKASPSQTVQPKPRLQTPEVDRGALPNSPTQDLSDVERKIRDPKATPSIEDAVRLAWNQALAQEQSVE